MTAVHGDKTVDDAARPRRARRDGGFTLSEVLVAVVLMGFAVSVVIAGIRTTIAVSQSSDTQAKVEAVLTSGADRLANWAYKPCPGPNGEEYAAVVQAASAAVDWPNSTVTIDPVMFWDPAANPPAGGGDPIAADGDWSFTNTLDGTAQCNEDINLTTARTLQRITIRVTAPDGSNTRTLEVIKSNIVADPTAAAGP